MSLFRVRFAALLGAQPDFTVIATAADGAEATRRITTDTTPANRRGS